MTPAALHNTWSLYTGIFVAGVRDMHGRISAWPSRACLLILLVTIYASIYHAMPLEKWGLIADQLIFYSVIAQSIVMASQTTRRDLGRYISEGRMMSFIQKPCSMLVQVISEQMGKFVSTAMIMMCVGTLFSLFVLDVQIQLSLLHIAAIILAIMNAGLIVFLIEFVLNLSEIFGPYSAPLDWMFGKMVFALGGLIIPLGFYSPVLANILPFTPFASILYIPANMATQPSLTWVIEAMMLQATWVGVLAIGAWLAQQAILKWVLTHGE